MLCILVAPAYSQSGASYGLICVKPEVLDRVAEILQAQGSRAQVLVDGVAEIPGLLPHTVNCAVLLRQIVYDTDRHGYVPDGRTVKYGFTVRQGRNGLFVDAPSVPRWLDAR